MAPIAIRPSLVAALEIELAASSLAGWIGVAIGGITLLVAIGAFFYAGSQLKQARTQADADRANARTDRLNALSERFTSRETSRAIIEGEEVLRICYRAALDRRLEAWDGIRHMSTKFRLRRAGVIYVLNLLEEMAMDCEMGYDDPVQAKARFGRLVGTLYEKWGWLIEEYEDKEKNLHGLAPEQRSWAVLYRKAERRQAESVPGDRQDAPAGELGPAPEFMDSMTLAVEALDPTKGDPHGARRGVSVAGSQLFRPMLGGPTTSGNAA